MVLMPPLSKARCGLPQGGLGAFQERRARIGNPGTDPRLQGVAHRHQLLRKSLNGELARIVDLALAALAEIVQFRHGAQIAVAILGGFSLSRSQCRSWVRAARPGGIRGNHPFGTIGFIHSLIPQKNGSRHAASRL